MVVVRAYPVGSTSNRQYLSCGGAVIDKRWVLTAAHCVSRDLEVSVRVRDLQLGTSKDDISGLLPEDVPVETFRHPDYKKVLTERYPFRHGGELFDVALLKLKKDLSFSDILKPLCLPTKPSVSIEYERLGEVFIAGWGFNESQGTMSSVMKWASVNITNHDYCKTTYHSVTDQHICANGKNRVGITTDTCNGDSGGPLMHIVKERGRADRWEAIGVASFGHGCGDPNMTGVYARVDYFLDWIERTMYQNS